LVSPKRENQLHYSGGGDAPKINEEHVLKHTDHQSTSIYSEIKSPVLEDRKIVNLLENLNLDKKPPKGSVEPDNFNLNELLTLVDESFAFHVGVIY